MSDYFNDALYGYTASTGTLGADMVNPSAASSSVDWGAILANGIRGAAQGAIAGQVAGAYQSGQLVAAQQQAQAANKGLITLLLIGGIAYVLMKA